MKSLPKINDQPDTVSHKVNTTDRLHADLLEDIFRLIDRPALISCLSVCRAWHAVSQSHLFRAVLIFHGGQHARNIDTFRRFLSVCPGVAWHVRNLTVVGGRHVPMSRQTRPDDYFTMITAATVDGVLSKLPALMELKLEGVLLAPSLTDPKGWSTPRPLTELRLQNTGFVLADKRRGSWEAPCGLEELLRLFGVVGTLHLDHVPRVFLRFNFSRTDSSQHSIAGGHLRIEKLVSVRHPVTRHSMHHVDALGLVNQWHGALSTLRDLELGDPTSESISNAMLQGTGSSSLQRLSLTLWPELKPDEKYDLTRCMALTRLQLILPLASTAELIIDQVTVLLSSLLTISSHTSPQITIEMTWDQYSHRGDIMWSFEMKQWKDVDMSFSRRANVGAMVVVFTDCLDPERTFGEVVVAFRQHLPGMHRMGLLKF